MRIWTCEGFLLVAVLKVNAGESPGRHSWSWDEYENELLFPILTLVKSLTVYSLGDVCVCVFICVFIHVPMLMYVHICLCACVYLSAWLCMHVCMYTCVDMCVYVWRSFKTFKHCSP